MPEWTELKMQDALQMHTGGILMNKAANAYGIPRSTFQAQISGSKLQNEHDAAWQNLASLQEKKLQDWIFTQQDPGCPMSHLQVRDFTSKMAVLNGFDDGFGKHWIHCFMRRSPDI